MCVDVIRSKNSRTDRPPIPRPTQNKQHDRHKTNNKSNLKSKQIRSVIGQIRPDRQTLLFSATFKKRVERLAQVNK